MKALTILFPSLLLLAIRGADLPPLVLPAGVGVNIHFTTGHERDLDRIAAAGFKVVRMDFGWAATEQKRGEYDWTAYDELTANLEKRGMRALYILDYSNPLYEEIVASVNPITGREQRDLASPQRPESVAAFARWAAAASRHFAGHGIIWEIWNEPNITFWKPKPDVEQYSRLALATAKSVREADPNATVIAPATSGLPIRFLEDLFASGLLAHIDAVSVHPYRSYSMGPETALEDYRILRDLISRHAPLPEATPLPIISGEWGYSTHAGKGVSREVQAAFLVRQQLINLHAGIPISIWYDWKDDGPDAAEREHNFGTVTHDLKAKPAYLAVQTLTRELSGYHVESRLPTARSEDFLLLLRKTDGSRKLSAWTTAEPHAVAVDVRLPGTTTVKIVHGDAREVEATVQDERLRLELGVMPQYVRLDRSEP
jgi:hypothetical protein